METLFEVSWRCPACNKVQHREWDNITPDADSSIPCAYCGKAWVFPEGSDPIRYCPICRAGELYRRKDFNAKLGIIITSIAAILSWWTYGVSLVVAVLIDLYLYRHVGDVVVCYSCEAHFRGLPKIKEYPDFSLLKYDKYRTRKKKPRLEEKPFQEPRDH